MKRSSSERYLYGIYRGVVMYNKDPLRIGRCKVNIPNVHGRSRKETIELLPWSRPMSSFATGDDSGSFIVPSVGMTVWVFFEGGDVEYPIYTGGFPGVVNNVNEVPTESYEGMQASKSPIGTMVYEPTAWTLFKSKGGATIGGQEAETKQKMWITDRIGQIFTSITPLKKNTPNRRKKPKLAYTDLLKGMAVSIYKSFGGGFLRFVSRKNGEKTELASKSGDTKASALHLESGKGQTLLINQSGGAVTYVRAVGGSLVLCVVEGGIVQSRITMTRKVDIYEYDPFNIIYDSTQFVDTKEEGNI